jgi:hypothetical protein
MLAGVAQGMESQANIKEGRKEGRKERKEEEVQVISK